ncbi:MAG: SulP family inorganic anion transporter [Bacilli bacterium]
MNEFKPRIFSVLKNYTWQQFLKDLISGIIVAVIALPLSIAFGIASGVTPEQGLYTAIFGGFMVSLLGGSRIQIGGPTGAFMMVVLGVIAGFGFDGLIIATIMAGIIMIGFGLLKLGSLIKFIPFPLVTGFTSGIAMIIFSSQINDFFGLGMTDIPAKFFPKWWAYITNFKNINFTTTLIGIISLLIIIFWPKLKYVKKIPATLIALVVATLIVNLFSLDSVATIGSTFGKLSTSIPIPTIPAVTFERVVALIPNAFVIAFLSAMVALLSAVVSDRMIEDTHNSNVELMAQGAANITSAVFTGIPVTGGLARTVANLRNGARTPIAGIIHSIVLLLFLVSLTPLIQLVPLSAFAAILFVAAYNMSEWRRFVSLFKAPKSDTLILVATFFFAIGVSLISAIGVGLALSMLLFMKRMSEVSTVESLEFAENMNSETLVLEKDLKDIATYKINGPFFFGTAYKFTNAIKQIQPNIKYLIIEMKDVPAIDATAMQSLKLAIQKCQSKGITILISKLNEQPKKALTKALFIDLIGSDKIFNTFEEAYAFAKTNL